VTKEAKAPKTRCSQTNMAVAIIKLPADPSVPRKGAVHVALGGWSETSTNFLVRFGEGFSALFSGYDMVAIGQTRRQEP
jgi:hypothetical protein